MIIDDINSVEDVKSFIQNNQYNDDTKDVLKKIWMKFFHSEPMKLLPNLEQHIRYYKPRGWVGPIHDFDFPELKTVEYVWVLFGGELYELGLRWYKKDAVEDFLKTIQKEN